MSRGGKREGSGRPCKGESPRSTVGVRMSPETRELMRQLAERHQCSGGDVVEKALQALWWSGP